MKLVTSFSAANYAAFAGLVGMFWLTGASVQALSLGSPATPFQHASYLFMGAGLVLVGAGLANPIEGEVHPARTLKVLAALLTMAAPVFAAVGHFLQPALG